MSDAFVVTPMSQNFQLEPGETYSGSITVANPGDSTSDFAYKISAAPYSVSGEGYEADLATMSNRSMIVDWVKIDNPKGILEPNETAKIDFTITVPENAPAGGQYASLLVTEDVETAVAQGVKVNSVFEIASLVYANVTGETVREGEILENNIPGFAVAVPIEVGALISNTGNTHQMVTTTLEVKNLITGETILPTEQNAGRYTEAIMPETTRRTNYEIADLPAVGVVRVNQTIYYNGNSSTEVKDILICPVWFMVVAVVVFFGLIFGAIFGVKKYRRKKSARKIV
ncbi:hypothetical protein IIY68_03785 [Candidatus Saccharibacteria bacterium]|nr:hypothetical protein [Candidatus Saccharibacteria bacterium]